jgi:TfoX/Sxy family transcriptional regulator of competence genes
MPYDARLDERIGGMIADWGTARKKMFGGTCHLINGNMMCGVYREYLILRLGEKQGRAALAKPHTKPFDITGRPMKGWIMVEQTGLSDAALETWLHRAREYVETLPPK